MGRSLEGKGTSGDAGLGSTVESGVGGGQLGEGGLEYRRGPSSQRTLLEGVEGNSHLGQNMMEGTWRTGLQRCVGREHLKPKSVILLEPKATS